MSKNAFQRLNNLIMEKDSRVCAGLDPTLKIIPKCVKQEILGDIQDEEKVLNPLTEKDYEDVIELRERIFGKYCVQYINAICDIVPAIKINSAFFEEWELESLYRRIARYAKSKGLFVIADVKRGDIGSTSEAYANAYLSKNSPFDAITINPYFGTDSVMPFFKLAKENDKGVFVLVKTSNQSSKDIQDLKFENGNTVYETVADKLIEWTKQVDYEAWKDDYPMIGAVTGATHVEQARKLAEKMGYIFLLIPGYGAQGATANDVSQLFDYYGFGAIVNSSRGIMNAYKKDCWKAKYSEEQWAEAAREEAIKMTKDINEAIEKQKMKK